MHIVDEPRKFSPSNVLTYTVCIFFHPLCYAAVLIKFTYYAQNYAQEYELCLVIITIYLQICMNKSLLIADNLERLFY